MCYFGYGSNMLTSRLQRRVPSAQPVMKAKLEDYALRFHKRSRDGSGKCNILPTDGAVVHGVLFDFSTPDLPALDEAEQQGRRYRRQQITVQGASAPVEAFAYVAEPAYVDDALFPYEWYHALVLAGAREHNLPDAYIEQIASVRSYPDPNQERRSKHKRMLEEAGFSLPDS